jgi:(p)ppGpp synthase/HD superfamily hydrolase
MSEPVPVFSPKIDQAVEIAAQWHDLTYRKSRWREPAFDVPPQEELRVPVMAHVTSVAMTVMRAGFDENTIAAALLHDSMEDVNRYGMIMRRERLVELMGREVAELVMQVTEEKYDSDGRKRTWRERKHGYLENVRAGTASAAAISVADKLQNIWSINQSLARGINLFEEGPNWESLNAGPDDQLWFYEHVLDATSHHDDERLRPLRRRFAVEIERFVRLAGISR